MKQTILTILLAALMVLFSSGSLYLGMTAYENDKFDENWRFSPTVIQEQLSPVYNEGDVLITTE